MVKDIKKIKEKLQEYARNRSKNFSGDEKDKRENTKK